MTAVSLALRRDPLDVLACLADEPGAFLLDVPDEQRPVTLLGCRPRATLVVPADDRDPLAAIARFVADAPRGALPFPLGGGVVGWLAYELGRATEPAGAGAAAPGEGPLAALARYDPLLVYDRTRASYLLVCADPGAANAPWLERLAAPIPTWSGGAAGGPLVAELPASWHGGAVERILDWLRAGDAYQVNLTQPFAAPLPAPPWVLHARLARRHPVPYGAHLALGGTCVVANSPELFLRRRGHRLETRPIKGTRPRGDTPAADAALAADLQRDPKERAEHVMIVDLERNDLGRVAEAGSVRVPAHARLETHPTLHHLVSTVTCTLRPGVGLEAILRATFPGGSITGAPKVRAMQLIRELEAGPRGPYTGAFGLLHPDGDMELGLAIRTAVVRDGRLRWHAGGGIVADSDPARELAEAWLKTAALRRALADEPAATVERCSSG
jgi:para-aminobenzoate synthetase component I